MMEVPKLNRVIRLDSTPLDQTYFTDEGYLHDRPILTRVGIFEYANSDGSVRRELRLPEDVFDPESLASYKGKPVILTHDAGLIDKHNVAEESIGTILSEGYRSGDDVRAEIIIHDTETMKRSRMKELSLGYSLDLEEEPGEWNGQHYDAIQRNIRINHLALVSEARAGDRARLNIDGRGNKSLPKEGGETMKKTHNRSRADGILSAEELEQAIAEYKKNHAAGAAPAEDGDDVQPVVDEPAEPKNGKPSPFDPKKKTAVADADDEEEKEVFSEDEDEEEEVSVLPDEKKEDEDEEAPAKKPGETIEEQVEEIKEANKDGDPDIQKLCDIIDSLLAEREFKAQADADEEEEEKPEFAEDDDDDDIPNQVAEDCGVNKDEDDDDIPSKEPDDLKPGEVINADSIDRMIRERVKIGMIGKALNMDGLENMRMFSAKKAVIKAVRPTMNLDGKSRAFINAAFDMACDEVDKRRRKDTKYQKRQMYSKKNMDSAVNTDSATSARERMIARMHNKNKEDK